MKKIYILLLVLAGMTTTFTACSTDDELISTATANDQPRILDPIFPDRDAKGNLATFATINRTDSLTMSLTVTPADYTTVTYYIDGAEVATGKKLKLPLLAGTYNLKIVASTAADLATSREGLVVVKPLASDPYSSSVASERIVAPGAEATAIGTNLEDVKSVKLGDVVVDNVTFLQTDEQQELKYNVPGDMADGVYRLTLIGKDGAEYGAETVTVSSSPLVVTGADRATSGSSMTITGINLDDVKSIAIGESTVTEFSSKTGGELTFTCPTLSDGVYQISGKTNSGETNSGETLMFYTSDGIKGAASITVTSETVLWAGHHYVSWDYPDGNPNKSFNLIGKDVFAGISAGSTLRVYYSIEPTAEYHQMQVTTGWWTNLPGTDKIEFSTDGVRETVLTQDALDLIQQQDGFLTVGHGFYVDRVTIQ